MTQPDSKLPKRTRARLFRLATFLTGIALIATVLLPPLASLPNGIVSLDSLLGFFLVITGAIALFLCLRDPGRTLLVAGLALVAAVLGLGGKFLAESTSETGFNACYQIQSPVSPEGQRTSACEQQFTWWAPPGATRLDPVIDFGAHDVANSRGLDQSTWFMPFINHKVYGYYDWDPTQPSRNRLPFNVYWFGNVEPGQDIDISYIGEGVVRTGSQTIFLEPAYAEPNSVQIGGIGSDLYIEYRWTDANGPDAPFASIKVMGADGVPLLAEAPLRSILGNLLAAGGSLAAAVLVIALAAQQVRSDWRSGYLSIRRWARIAVPLGVLGGLVLWQVPVVWKEAVLAILLFLLLTITRIYTNARTTRIFASATITGVALFSAFGIPPLGRQTLVLRGGDDFLTYVSFAREILIQSSLRGGEDVFQYSPAIRYWLFGHFSLLGEDLRAVHAVSLVLLLAVAWWALSRLVFDRFIDDRGATSAQPRRDYVLLYGSAVTLGLLVGGYTVWFGGLVLLSEYPTWPLIMTAMILALTNHGRRRALIALGLIAGALISFRNHQLVGALTLVILGIATAQKATQDAAKRTRLLGNSMAVTAPLLVFPALIALHNWVYAGRFVLRDPQQVGLTTVIPFTNPGQLFATDPQTVLSQLAGLGFINYGENGVPFDLAISYSSELGLLSPTGVGIRVIQVGYLLACVWVLKSARNRSFANITLLLTPLTFLAPHFFLNVFTYYPRHIIAAYTAAALVVLAVAGKSMKAGKKEQSQDQMIPARSEPL